MGEESSKEIDEIMFETNYKIMTIVDEMRLFKFSKMDEGEKQTKYDALRKEFEKTMYLEEEKVKKIMEGFP
ncbi:hypothetical protein [Candidatus Nitrosopumilus sediminis]|uniref:Uncharacterized protein n=1 Tax=Candidatus Nitrosopumilus sediminis TaxID=1229909 RepID=K0BB67_9ARCH|nr:hypothetical protein [Candidatus Nitrosopumilus sediminis]AFS83408.1 hypothetical protein NSED_08080 [Candidatus Nitrosopumilus sediminis]